jgi:GntR family transcriptional regulator
MARKYERVADDLRRKILRGELAPGEQLEAQTSLAERYRVSLPTVQQALGVLEAEGLLDAVHGIGTYVRANKQPLRRKADRYQWEKNRALLSEEERKATGGTEHDTGLNVADLEFYSEYHIEEADHDLAEALEVPPGTRLLHRVYQTSIKSERTVISMSDSYLVYDMVAVNPDLLDASNEPWPGGTHHQLRTAGIEIDRVIDEVSARPPRGDETELLGIKPGVAVLTLRKTSYDVDGRVIEVANAIMPGDRTILTFETKLERWPS